jgi:hypothetical protein
MCKDRSAMMKAFYGDGLKQHCKPKIQGIHPEKFGYMNYVGVDRQHWCLGSKPGGSATTKSRLTICQYPVFTFSATSVNKFGAQFALN